MGPKSRNSQSESHSLDQKLQVEVAFFENFNLSDFTNDFPPWVVPERDKGHPLIFDSIALVMSSYNVS